MGHEFRWLKGPRKDESFSKGFEFPGEVNKRQLTNPHGLFRTGSGKSVEMLVLSVVDSEGHPKYFYKTHSRQESMQLTTNS